MTNPPLSAEEVRAAAEVHRELGPEFSDAVVESFLARIDQEIGARVDARLASVQRARMRPVDPARRARRRAMIGGAAFGALVAGTPLTIFAFGMAEPRGSSGVLVVIWLVVGIVLSGWTFLLSRRS
jgi:hypothetical protein